MAVSTLSADLFMCLTKNDCMGGVSQHAYASLGWDAKETLFVLLLERLGRPTLAQYTTERRNFQKRPAEARMTQRRWSEEAFRNIFLKILLKDLKELGFVRVLSIDDLLTKRRACLQAMGHLMGLIDPSFVTAAPTLSADSTGSTQSDLAAGHPQGARTASQRKSGEQFKEGGVGAESVGVRAVDRGGTRGEGRLEEAGKGKVSGQGGSEAPSEKETISARIRQRPSSAVPSVKSPHRDAARASLPPWQTDDDHALGSMGSGAASGQRAETPKGINPGKQAIKKLRAPLRASTLESRPAWVSDATAGAEGPSAHDWEDDCAAEGMNERDGWMLASIATPKRPKAASSAKDQARIEALEEGLATVRRERDLALADLEEMRLLYTAAVGDARGVNGLTLGRIRTLMAQNLMLVRQTSELSRGVAERGAVAERVEAVLLSLTEKLQRAGADQDSRVLAAVNSTMQSVQNEVRRAPLEIAHINETGNRSGAGLISLCEAYADVVDTKALLSLEGYVNDIRGEVLAVLRELDPLLHRNVRDKLMRLRDVLDAATDSFLDAAVLVPTSAKERKSNRKSAGVEQDRARTAVQASLERLIALLPPAVRKREDVVENIKVLQRQQARLIQDAGTSLRGEEPPEPSVNEAWEQVLRGGDDASGFSF